MCGFPFARRESTGGVGSRIQCLGGPDGVRPWGRVFQPTDAASIVAVACVEVRCRLCVDATLPIRNRTGVRFARLFVLVVPIGMAFVGLSIGEGRAAYASDGGQAMVLVAFALMAACWWWASRLLQLPDEQRVFVGHDRDDTGQP